MNRIEINLDPLGLQERWRARYLAALSGYRVLAARFAEEGHADLDELDAARDECARWEPTPEERARPAREVAEMYGISVATIRRWCAERQVWCEKRYGKLWYVDPKDVELLVASDAVRPGWPLGRKRA